MSSSKPNTSAHSTMVLVKICPGATSKYCAPGKGLTVHGTPFTIHGTGLTEHGRRATVHGNAPPVHGMGVTLHGRRPTVYDNPFAFCGITLTFPEMLTALHANQPTRQPTPNWCECEMECAGVNINSHFFIIFAPWRCLAGKQPTRKFSRLTLLPS